jgi:hypothetical protein
LVTCTCRYWSQVHLKVEIEGAVAGCSNVEDRRMATYIRSIELISTLHMQRFISKRELKLQLSAIANSAGGRGVRACAPLLPTKGN